MGGAGGWARRGSCTLLVAASLSIATALVVTPAAEAATRVTATWRGVRGDWNDATKWDIGVVPNNGRGRTYDVVIDGDPSSAAAVTLDAAVTVDHLTVAAGDRLDVRAGAALTVRHDARSAGTLAVDGTLAAAGVTVVGGTLTGAGTVASDVDVERGTTRLDAGAELDVVGTYRQGPSATLRVTIDGARAGRVHVQDPTEVRAVVALGGTLQLTLARPAVAGARFTIVEDGNWVPLLGGPPPTAFRGLPEGAILSSGVNRFRLDYAGGDGNDVTLASTGPVCLGRRPAAPTGDGELDRCRVFTNPG